MVPSVGSSSTDLCAIGNLMTLPNFLVIGVSKGGTTSVYHYLKQHPQVFMSPIKETNFFVYDGRNPLVIRQRPNRFPVKTLHEFGALFATVSGEKAIGEASPLYLTDSVAAMQIRHHIPRAKLIAILRDPADRAYSDYAMGVRDRMDSRSFAEAIADEERQGFEESREFSPRHYVRPGFYARQLKHYFQLFERSQIAVYLFDDLQADAVGFMRTLFHFLRVDEDFVPDASLRHNPSAPPQNKLLRPLLRKSALTCTVKRLLPEPLGRRAVALQLALRNRTQVEQSSIPSDLRRKLVGLYRQDILELQDLIQRDLSRWLA